MRLFTILRTTLGLFSLAILAGCADPEPSMLDDQTAVISGSLTEGQSQPEAAKTVVTQAAIVTVDHGFQYFRIVRDPSLPDDSTSPRSTSAIQPGQDVTVKVFHAGDVAATDPGIWDAEKILAVGRATNAGTMGSTMSGAAPDYAAPSAAPPGSYSPPDGIAMPPPPRCTAYGCDW